MSFSLKYIALFSCLLPIFSFILRFRTLDNALKLLAVYFLVVGLVEIGEYTMYKFNVNNMPLFNIFSLFEGIVFFIVTYLWSDTGTGRKLSIAFLLVYTLYWIYTTVWILPLNKLNTNENTIKGIFLILISGYLLVRLSLKSDVYLFDNYLFWFNAAILIYFSLTLAMFYSASFVFEGNQRVMLSIWKINLISVIIANTIFAYGYICYFQKKNFIT